MKLTLSSGLVNTHSTVWSVCKRRIGRQVETWTETVPIDSILMTVSFTKSNRLPNEYARKLKERYAGLLLNSSRT